jgi:hypothetical protein
MLFNCPSVEQRFGHPSDHPRVGDEQVISDRSSTHQLYQYLCPLVGDQATYDGVVTLTERHMPESIDLEERQSLDVRDVAGLAVKFHIFGRVETPQVESPMYAELSYGISQDPELVELAAHTRLGQPPPNMLFAAVHFLLLSGVDHPLAAHYPAISGEPRPLVPAFPAFRDFCLAQREAIIDLLRTRLTQTNVVQRCVCLLPAFAKVHRDTSLPLALIEVGPSAGLNMNWDRYHYCYVDADDQMVAEWGDANSPVMLRGALRGGRFVPIAPDLPVVWRVGVDINPIDIDDDDQVRWLRALIWPEHVERHGRLLSAIEVAQAHPPEMMRGDAVELVPELLARAPATSAIVVYATHALYQMTREDRVRLLKSVEAFAIDRGRRVDLVLMEAGDADYSQIALHTYLPAGRTTHELAHANPHGRWLRWLDTS